VPSLAHSSAPVVASPATKNARPPTAVICAGASVPSCATLRVPAAVPSVAHSTWLVVDGDSTNSHCWPTAAAVRTTETPVPGSA
jgi:hypothetical protein